MKIYKNKFNTLPMQVEENMKNIELLASIIKESYRSDIQLLTTDVSIAISDTNANTDTIDGWLIDPIGKIFKITGGDGTNLLIEFYSDIRGEQGVQGEQGNDGADGNDGANGLSFRLYAGLYINNSTSYQKSTLADSTNLQVGDIVLFVNGVLAKVSTLATNTFKVTNNDNIEIQSTSKGYYYAKVQPTISGDNLIYAKTSIFNNVTPCVFAFGDMITYIDSNDEPTELYEITGFSGNDLIVELKGTFAKGKQLYHHTIQYYRYAGGAYTRAIITTVNTNPNKINTLALFKQWLTDNGYETTTPRLCVGDNYDSGWRMMRKIWIDGNNQINYSYFTGSTNQSGTDVNDTGTVEDSVEEC